MKLINDDGLWNIFFSILFVLVATLLIGILYLINGSVPTEIPPF